MYVQKQGMSFRSRMLTERHKFQSKSDSLCTVYAKLTGALFGNSDVCGNHKNEEEADNGKQFT